ncbi:MAG: endonuclease domain-containing protein [Sphingomonadaceae bacterium]|nr:endonuclease domain-containing protein [Sphingomonadaceae bacterium]
MMRLRTSPRLKPETVARSRALRRAMTEAELVLWKGLGEALPDARFRTQAPLGPYYADFVSHRCRLVIEVDGGQHGEKLDYDAARTHFMNGEGYRVLRFWNNEVLRNLDGVLAAIAAQIPSPLVGEGGAKRRMGGARRSRAPAQRAGTPHPLPSPTRGEGE